MQKFCQNSADLTRYQVHVPADGGPRANLMEGQLIMPFLDRF